MPTRPHSRKPRATTSFEGRLRVYCTIIAVVVLGLVAALLALFHVSAGPMGATLAILLLVLLLVFAAFIDDAVRPIQTLANVVAALREEDYSFRARGASREDALGQLSLEINALADTLQAQRLSALEAVALLRRVIAEMDAPVLAFDQDARLRLLNPAAERVFSLLPVRDLGKTAADLHLASLLDQPSQSILQLEPRVQATRRPQSGAPADRSESARWMIRRGSFRQRGVPHTLVLLSDVSVALREEERLAWRRLIRVIGHEISNSLTPIKSIAGSLRSRLQPQNGVILSEARREAASGVEGPAVSDQSFRTAHPSPSLNRDLNRGLGVIENRADSLNRFVQAYRQLAQLPAPVLKHVPLVPLLERVVSLEIRLDVRILSAPDVDLLADPDQIEQLLINLVRNAVEAATFPLDLAEPPVPASAHGEPTPATDAPFSGIGSGSAIAKDLALAEPTARTEPAPPAATSSSVFQLSPEGDLSPATVSPGAPVPGLSEPQASRMALPEVGRSGNEKGRAAADRSPVSQTTQRVPEVTIRALEDGDVAAIQIEDNGPGLANPENLFVPLYTTKKSGSGVGLALARQIVEAHGGAITLRNRADGTGCVAEVRMPIAERTRA